MATDLSETLSRLQSKSSMLLEKYRALEARNGELEQQLADVQSDNAELRLRLERLQRDHDYLVMARAIAADSALAGRYRSVIAQIVRDIDKCIAQLNA